MTSVHPVRNKLSCQAFSPGAKAHVRLQLQADPRSSGYRPAGPTQGRDFVAGVRQPCLRLETAAVAVGGRTPGVQRHRWVQYCSEFLGP